MSARRITIAAGLAFSAALAVGMGCAGKGRGSASPAECMQTCEGECPYVPDGLGDNDEYLECLEACEDRCGVASE